MTEKKKGTAKAPPAKRTRQPRAVPRVVPMSGGGSTARLFSADDVTALAADAAVSMKPDVDIEAVATDLHNAFDSSLSCYGIDESRSTPAGRRDWFSELQRNATALLSTLGHENSVETLWGFNDTDASKIGRQNIRFEYNSSDLYQKGHILPWNVRNLVNQKALQEARDFRQEHAAIADEPVSSLAELQTYQRVAVLPLLEIAPWLIALLAELGRTGAARHSEQAGKATKPKECWREVLFLHLADVYEAMTGRLPNVHTVGKRDAGLPAVKWFQAVLAMAASRADSVFKLYNLVSSDAIRPLSTKSAATIAGYIERGKTASRARKGRVSMESP